MQRIKQRKREREREREKRRTQSNYTGSFHKPKVVLSPLHFQGEFTKNVISDYNCSMLQLARDFKLLKHTCKRFPMLLNTVTRLLLLKHTSKRLLLLMQANNFYSNKITRKYVWGWRLDIQSVVFTIQMRYRLFKTLEFLRYGLL